MERYGQITRDPRHEFQQSLVNCLGKLARMQSGADDVLGLIPAANLSQQVSTSFNQSCGEELLLMKL